MTRRLKLWLFGAVLLVLMIALSGCSAGGNSAALFTGSSWPGSTVDGDIIYLAAGGQVFAIEADTGDTIWAYPSEASRNRAFFASPAVNEDLVVVGDYTDTLVALNRNTGREEADFQTDRGKFIGSAALTSEYVLVGTTNGNLYALDINTFEPVWSFRTGRAIWSTPLVDGENVYITALDRHLYSIDLRSGQLQWKFPADNVELEPEMGAIVGTPTLHNGVLYFGSFNNMVYALDAATQQIKWTYEATHWVWSSPVIDEEYGVAIGGDLDGHVFALDLESGEERWVVDTKGPVTGSPIIEIADDGTHVVYVNSGASEQPNIYKLNAEDGDYIASPFTFEAQFTTRVKGTDLRAIPLYAPPVIFDDMLLISIDQSDSSLYALDKDTLLERWVFEPAGS